MKDELEFPEYASLLPGYADCAERSRILNVNCSKRSPEEAQRIPGQHPRLKAVLLRHTKQKAPYLRGRFRGIVSNVANAGALGVEVGVHRCQNPLYVYAKIKSLQKLLRVQ